MFENDGHLKPFTPSDWYWRKADGSLFSSARIATVAASDEAYVEWVATGGVATRYPVDTEGNESETELQAVLDAYGLHANLAHYAGALRWDQQVSGVTVVVGGGAYRFATDGDGRSSLNEALDAAADVEAVGGAGSFKAAWKTLDGFTKDLLKLADLQTVGRAVRDHVLSCFAKEAAAVAAIAAGTISTKEAVEAAFAPAE